MTTITANETTIDEVYRLHSKLHTLRNEYHRMQQINEAYQSGPDAVVALGFSETEFMRIHNTIQRNPAYGKLPFPAGIVQNKAAQIKRMETKIAEYISDLHSLDRQEQHNGFTFAVDVATWRIVVKFDHEATPELNCFMREHFFTHRPKHDDWVMRIASHTLAAAEEAIQELLTLRAA